MFILQESETRKSPVDLEPKNLEFDSIKKQSKTLKFQPEVVVNHMMNVLKSACENGQVGTNVTWETFVKSSKYLIPGTMTDKMTLFLRAVAP